MRVKIKGKRYHALAFKKYKKFPKGSLLLIPAGPGKAGRSRRRKMKAKRSKKTGRFIKSGRKKKRARRRGHDSRGS